MNLVFLISEDGSEIQKLASYIKLVCLYRDCTLNEVSFQAVLTQTTAVYCRCSLNWNSRLAVLHVKQIFADT